MRRTDEEFKAEVLRRCDSWRARRRKRRRTVMAVCLPVLLCGSVWMVLLSGGWGRATESVNLTADTAFSEECLEAPAAAAPQEVFVPDVQESEIEGEESNGSGGCYANVLSIEVNSQPESPDYAKTFTEPAKTAAIMEAIQAFYDDPDTTPGGSEIGECEGMAYRIVVTEQTITRVYTLFHNALSSDSEEGWYVNPEAYEQLERLILQESDK